MKKDIKKDDTFQMWCIITLLLLCIFLYSWAMVVSNIESDLGNAICEKEYNTSYGGYHYAYKIIQCNEPIKQYYGLHIQLE